MSASSLQSVAGIDVSRETHDALEAFTNLVRHWNPAINLVSKASIAELWDRHIIDSAHLFLFCPPDAKLWVDIGSGGGFPGIVVAILAREHQPELRLQLVEADLRKATFLRQAARTLGLTVVVHSKRIESITPAFEADVFSARALASLDNLLNYAAPHLRHNGVALFPKGGRHAEEIANARKHWLFDEALHPSISDPSAAILEIRNISRAI